MASNKGIAGSCIFSIDGNDLVSTPDRASTSIQQSRQQAKEEAQASKVKVESANTEKKEEKKEDADANPWFIPESYKKHFDNAKVWNKLVKYMKPSEKKKEDEVIELTEDEKKKLELWKDDFKDLKKVGCISVLNNVPSFIFDEEKNDFVPYKEGWVVACKIENQFYVAVDPILKATCTILSGKGKKHVLKPVELINMINKEIKDKLEEGDTIELPKGMHPSGNRAMLGMKSQKMSILFDFIKNALKTDRKMRQIIVAEANKSIKKNLYLNCMLYDTKDVAKLIDQSIDAAREFGIARRVRVITRGVDKD